MYSDYCGLKEFISTWSYILTSTGLDNPSLAFITHTIILGTLCENISELVVQLHIPIFSGCHALLFCLNYQEGKNALLRASKVGNLDAVIRELTGHTDVNSQDEVSLPHLLRLNIWVFNVSTFS